MKSYIKDILDRMSFNKDNSSHIPFLLTSKEFYFPPRIALVSPELSVEEVREKTGAKKVDKIQIRVVNEERTSPGGEGSLLEKKYIATSEMGDYPVEMQWLITPKTSIKISC